jgi:hypothetical protein
MYTTTSILVLIFLPKNLPHQKHNHCSNHYHSPNPNPNPNPNYDKKIYGEKCSHYFLIGAKYFAIKILGQK